MRTIAILGLAGLLSACGGGAEQPALPAGDMNAAAPAPALLAAVKPAYRDAFAVR